MASDIVTTLQLDKSPGKLIVVKEVNNCDSYFIISCVLSHFVKNRHGVLFVVAHNSLSHYQNVGIKMNYNLQKHIDSGLVTIYCLGEECVSNILESKQASLESILLKLKEIILDMRKKFDVVNIILDGITHLFDLQYSLVEINSFCNELVKFSRNDKSFILYHCNVASDDDVSNVMPNLLSHKANTLLEIESLPSGWSADVSGHLTVKQISKKFEDGYIFAIDLKPTKYLFKLFDRGVKLFAPGTI